LPSPPAPVTITSPPPPSPRLLSPRPPSPSFPAVDTSIPAGGVQVLEGGKDGVITFCLKPGMERVTSVTDVPGASTQMRNPQIAAQCCTAADECRRTTAWPVYDRNQCQAGMSGNLAPFITLMTYAETVAKCAAAGLQLCAQSCKGLGCNYNRHPVYTNLPCPAEPPSPAPSPLPLPPPPPRVWSSTCSAHPRCAHLAGDCCPTATGWTLGCCDASPAPLPSPPTLSPSPNPPGAESPLSPPPPPPAEPPIRHAPWVPAASGDLYLTTGEGDEQFTQRCLRLCLAAGSSCVGFADTTCGASESRCCRFSSSPAGHSFFQMAGQESVFFRAPTEQLAGVSLAGVKLAGASAVESAPSALSAPAVATWARVNPFDDSYGLAATAVEDTTPGSVEGAASGGESNRFSLIDYRVVLVAIGALTLGGALGAFVGVRAVMASALHAPAGSAQIQEKNMVPKPPLARAPSNVINGLIRRASGSQKACDNYQHRLPSERGDEEWQPALAPAPPEGAMTPGPIQMQGTI